MNRFCPPVRTRIRDVLTLDPNVDPTFRSIPNDRKPWQTSSHLSFDHRINDKQNLSLYYFFNDTVDSQPFTRFQAATPSLLDGFWEQQRQPVCNRSISPTLGTINNSTVNEARITYFRESAGNLLAPAGATNNVTDSCDGIGVLRIASTVSPTRRGAFGDAGSRCQ